MESDLIDASLLPLTKVGLKNRLIFSLFVVGVLFSAAEILLFTFSISDRVKEFYEGQ